jgi:2'-5' RNA ligase
MRLFLAVDIPNEVKKELDMQLEPLKKEYPYLKWVPPQNYHVTLFFFGDRFPKDMIQKHVENVTFDSRSFHMYTGENGILMRNTLTFYAGFLKCQPIEQMVKRIKTEMNIVDDLKFFPHLTVARYRIPSKQQYLLLKKKWLKMKLDVEFEVSQITLYESVIEKNVPIYAPQTTFPLLSRIDD